jgi:cytosine deaminase
MGSLSLRTPRAFVLINARVPRAWFARRRAARLDADGLAPCSIVIDNARIADIGPAVQDGLPRVDLDNGIVLPRLVDVHTHIDKGHIWHRAQNPDGTHLARALP